VVLGRVGDPQAPANGDPIDQVGRADPIERPGQVDHRLAQTVPVVVPVVVPAVPEVALSNKGADGSKSDADASKKNFSRKNLPPTPQQTLPSPKARWSSKGGRQRKKLRAK